jgi:putative DNA primase/helicase
MDSFTKKDGEASTPPSDSISNLHFINNNRKVFLSQNHQAAVMYAERFGFYVFPLMPGTKVPMTFNGFKSASNERAIIDDWWSQWPNANIGIATEASGLVVLDIDDSSEVSALDTLTDLESKVGRLPDTPHVLTGGGGFQFYFKTEDYLSSRTRVLPNIDIKASGGYVVAPPSKHPSGRKYLWDDIFKITQMPIAEAPDFLIDLAQPKGMQPIKRSPQYWTEIYLQGASEGSRNDTATKLAGYLIQKNLEPFLVVEIMKAWNLKQVKPPLDESELLGILDSVAKMEIQKRRV